VAVWKAGPTCFCIRFTSEPAYSTSTGPDPVAVDVGEVEALPDELGEELLDELLGELEQAAAASPTHAMNTAAANRLLDDRKVSIPRP
jgi:hypothetical protein